ncbi:MAG: hypothetical protein FJ215_02880 [Ignavibacteria bacterium]|nr:hypothetical protein [Ignavibacteria bacterium]
MKRVSFFTMVASLMMMLALIISVSAQTEEETTIKIKTVKVEQGDTTIAEQTLTPKEFDEMKKKGEFKDIEIQMKKGREEGGRQKITKEIRVTTSGRSDKDRELEIEVREVEDGKEVVKILKGKEAEKYHKHMKHSEHEHKAVEKKTSKKKESSRRSTKD